MFVCFWISSHTLPVYHGYHGNDSQEHSIFEILMQNISPEIDEN